MRKNLTVWALFLALLFSGTLPVYNRMTTQAAPKTADIALTAEENGDTYLDLKSPTLGAAFGSRLYIYDQRGEDYVVEVLNGDVFERTLPDAPAGGIKLQAGEVGVFLLTDNSSGNQVYLFDGSEWRCLETIRTQLAHENALSLNDIVYRNGELYLLYSYLDRNLMTECVIRFTFDADRQPEIADQIEFSISTLGLSEPKCNAFVLITNDSISDRLYVLSNIDQCLYSQPDSSTAKPVAVLKKTYTHLSTDNQYLYLSSSVGLEAFLLDSEGLIAAAEAAPTETEQYSKGSVNEYTSTFASDGQVFVVNRESRALTSFVVSGSEFILGTTAAYSASEEGYAAPSSVYATEEAVYVADSQNHRIKRIVRGNEAATTSLEVAQSPETVCADEQGNLWYLAKGLLYWVRGFSASNIYDKPLEGIRSIAADDRGGLYALNNEGIHYYPNSTDSPTRLEISESGILALYYLDKSKTLYLLTANAVLRYDPASCSKLETIPLASGITADRFQVDYYENLYLFNGKSGAVTVWSASERSYQSFSVTLTRNGRQGTLLDFAIDRKDGSLLFASADMNCVARAPLDALSAKVRTDAPACRTSVDIYSGKAQNVLKYVTVSSYSAVFYPDGEAAATLPDGSRVMVLEEQDDYSYVFWGDQGGWIYNRYTEATQIGASALSGKDMRVLVNNTAYLILPSLRETDADQPLYQAGILAKGDSVRVSADLGEIDGIHWLEILRGSETYYLPLTAIGEYRDESVYLYEYLTLSSAQSEVSLYADPDVSSEVLLTLPNHSKVILVQHYDNGWYCVQAQNGDGELVTCYVHSDYVVPDGLTSAQKTGLILFAVIIIVGIVLLIVRKKVKKI